MAEEAGFDSQCNAVVDQKFFGTWMQRARLNSRNQTVVCVAFFFEHDATVCKQVLAQKVLNLPCEVLGLL